MKKIILTTFLLIGLFLCSSGQNYKVQFNDLWQKKDTLGQEQLLIKWKSAKPDDPELYVEYFNFYVNKSRTEIVRLDKNPKGDYVLKLMDKDTTKKEPVAYMYDDIYYKPELLKIGYAYIDTGIAKFPRRLDMRFGKVYMLGETKDYDAFTKEIIKTIDYSAVIGNKWTWSDNEPVKDDPNKFMLSNIQGYFIQLNNTGDNAQTVNMKQIAESVLKYYPDNVENLSNLSICYMLSGDFSSALTPLLKAEKFAPKDYIVLNNIAHCYLELKDNKKAIKYYELTEKYGDGDAKALSKKKLIELRNK